MRLLDTSEMIELRKIYEPYIDKGKGYKLVEDAPKEAVEAYNRYFELREIQRNNEIKSWFD